MRGRLPFCDTPARLRDRLADRRPEALDARAVAPVPGELARARALRSPELFVVREPTQSRGGGVDVAGRDEEAVLAVAEEVVGGPDPVGEDEREPAGRGLVDHDRP